MQGLLRSGHFTQAADLKYNSMSHIPQTDCTVLNCEEYSYTHQDCLNVCHDKSGPENPGSQLQATPRDLGISFLYDVP